MAPRISRPILAAVGLAMGLALLCSAVLAPLSMPGAAPVPAPAEEAGRLATYRQLLRDAGAQASAQPQARDARVRALVALDLAPLALSGGPSPATRQARAGELEAAQAQLAASVEGLGGVVVAHYSHAVTALAVELDATAMPALAALPGVAAVVPIGDYTTAQAEPANAIGQAELAALLGADEVRSRGNDGAGVELAVIDSGVDYTHSKLGGPGDQAAYRRAVCGSADLSPGDPGCNPAIAPPAELFPNAKVRGGLDLLGDVWPARDPRCGTLGTCPVADLNPIDLNGHGTHVADIAAGLPTTPGGDDGGVAPGASLWAFKACNGTAGLCNGVAILSAIDAALDLDRSASGGCTAGAACLSYDPADIIVLAFSFSYGQPEDAVTLFVNLAGFYGSLVVAAAGNDGPTPFIVGSPATASAALAVAESALPTAAGETVAASASRGPRILDNALKPDLAAPGAVVSAQAGGGTALSPFAGSSGSAPVAAGVAALVVQELEEKGALDPDPGLADAPGATYSLAPLVKTVLMNTAFDGLEAPGGGLAPLSLQGAGRVDALRAFTGRTLAVDATAMVNLLSTSPELNQCTVRPYLDLLFFRLLGTTPPCAAYYPGGDPLFRAWNAQTGSVSFGYRPTVGYQELTRQVAVVNYSRSPRSYNLSTELRFAGDQGRGVGLSVTPSSFELAGGAGELVTLTLTLSPSALREWPNSGGELGEAACDLPGADCPAPGMLEVDGAIVIDGGSSQRVRVPVHVLPRLVADVSVARIDEAALLLSNRSAFAAGEVTPFALVDISPNKCDSGDEACTSPDYTPGDRPGSGESPVDLNYIGLRSYSLPGVNAAFGLPATDPGALADEVVEFAVTVHDRPFRASPNAPARFEVAIDGDGDGAIDYVAYNAVPPGDLSGRSRVFVRDENPADGTRPTQAYLSTVAGFNTQRWVLPVPATAVGVRSDRAFRFVVRALDASFTVNGQPVLWDCSPGPVGACGAATHTMQTGALRFRPIGAALRVAPETRALLPFVEDDGALAGSPSQIGLLLVYDAALPGQEVEGIRLR